MIGHKILGTINLGITRLGTINLSIVNLELIARGALLGRMTGGVTMPPGRMKEEGTTRERKGVGVSDVKNSRIRRL
jgi:hypothetical protein